VASAKPARFSLRTAVAETAREPFEFEGPNGEDLRLPHASCLTLRQAERIDAGELAAVINELDTTVADLMVDLPGYAIEQLVTAWLAHAGTSSGESAASSNSSTSTGRPSTSTSRAAASRSPRSARRR